VPTTVASDAPRIALWSWREDVWVEADPAGASALLHTRWGEVVLDRPGRRVAEALRRMTLGPVYLDNVVAGGTPERDRLAELLDGVQDVVVRSLGTEDGMGPLLSVVPVGRHATFRPRPPAPDRPVRLSRRVTLRPGPGALVLASPRAAHRVLLHQPVARAVTAALGAPISSGAVAEALRLPTGLAGDLVGYLSGTGMVVPADAAAMDPPTLGLEGSGAAELG
jgi:hypothetical protein